MTRMIQKVWPVLGMLALMIVFGSGASASVTEDEAVQAAVLDYAEGWTTGDAQRMAGVLHPAALKRRVVTDVLSGEPRVQVLSAEEIIQATRDGAGKPLEPGPLNLRVAILDRHGDMATARVVSPLYVHYLQMARWEGRWVVLAVMWGTIASPGE